MTIFIASWAMLFASLFFAYALTRLRAPFWPPLDLPALPLGLPAAATACSCCWPLSPWCAAGNAGGRAARRRDPPAAGGAGRRAMFLVLQTGGVAVLLAGRAAPETGTYASVFYGLTVFHALHVLVGRRAGARPRPCARRRGRLSAVSLRLWTLYLHMVAVSVGDHVRGGVPAVTRAPLLLVLLLPWPLVACKGQAHVHRRAEAGRPGRSRPTS